MTIYLGCRGYGIGLDLPATPDIVASRLCALREGLSETTPVHISDVSSQMAAVLPYIQHADLENDADLQKLNVLAGRIDDMTPEEQDLFFGALTLERGGGLDDVVRIVTSLDRYEIFSKIKTDEDLGRFLVDTSFVTGKYLFPKETWPYPDYAKIGSEQRDIFGGVNTPHGLVRRREEAPVQTDTSRTMLLTLAVSEQSHCLALPAAADQLEYAKRSLGIEDFSQARITGIEDTAPYLEQLIPMDGVTVEGADKMALCLQQLKADGEIMKYCAALEAEEPSTFSRALDMGMGIDNYELVTDNERAYGRESLRRIGADEELLDTIDGYTDFEQLGRAMMEEDGVRLTEFGLVRRLDRPFPEPEIGPTMG